MFQIKSNIKYLTTVIHPMREKALFRNFPVRSFVSGEKGGGDPGRIDELLTVGRTENIQY